MRVSKLVLAVGTAVVGVTANAAPQTYLVDQQIGSSESDIPQLGFSVAIRDDEALVVAPKQSGSMFGPIILYRLSGRGNWVSETTFAYSEPGHNYGAYVGCNGVAVDGDQVAIGLSSSDSFHGTVQMSENRGVAGWVLSQTLSPPSPSGFESFGCSVSLSGTTLAVGAPGHGGHGAVYVYTYDGRGWNLQATLTPSGVAGGDGAGFSLSIDGDRLVLGSPHANSDTGAAYIFVRSGTAWTQAKKLTGLASGDQFGASIAISGTTVVVGSPDAASGTGSVRAFDTNGVEQSIVTPAGAKNFGSSVSVSGTRVIAGAIGSKTAYAFTQSGKLWYQRSAFSDVPASMFGAAVAISGLKAILGSPAVDSMTAPVDQAYIVHDDDVFFNGHQ